MVSRILNFRKRALSLWASSRKRCSSNPKRISQIVTRKKSLELWHLTTLIMRIDTQLNQDTLLNGSTWTLRWKKNLSRTLPSCKKRQKPVTSTLALHPILLEVAILQVPCTLLCHQVTETSKDVLSTTQKARRSMKRKADIMTRKHSKSMRVQNGQSLSSHQLMRKNLTMRSQSTTRKHFMAKSRSLGMQAEGRFVEKTWHLRATSSARPPGKSLPSLLRKDSITTKRSTSHSLVLPVSLSHLNRKSHLQDSLLALGLLLLPPIASKDRLIPVKLSPNGLHLLAGLQEMSHLSKNLVQGATKKTNKTEENLRGKLNRTKDLLGTNLRSQRKNLLFLAVISPTDANNLRSRADPWKRMKIKSLVQNLRKQVKRISWKVSENCSSSISALLSTSRMITASTLLSSTETEKMTKWPNGSIERDCLTFLWF